MEKLDPAAAFDTDPNDGIQATSHAPGKFRYFEYVMAAFVAILLLSNIIGAAKLSTVAGFTFGAGILFFPVSYVIGDILTEVYGYARARRVIWTGFAAGLSNRVSTSSCGASGARRITSNSGVDRRRCSRVSTPSGFASLPSARSITASRPLASAHGTFR